MSKLRVLSGKEVIKILIDFGFEVVVQRGSHVKLQRIINGTRQTLTIPNHKELDRGTVRAIYRQASRYVAEEKLAPLFYSI